MIATDPAVVTRAQSLRDAAQPNYQLAVRAEHIHIQPTSTTSVHHVPAQVVFRRYLGFKVTYCLRLVDGSTLMADIPTAADPRKHAGDSVFLHFSPECRLVLA
jgi:iron(III) transport system ATP-binding protein